MSRNLVKAFFAFTTLGLAAACADTSSVAPTATEAPKFVAPANFVRTGYLVYFKVDNAKGITKKIGNHVLSLPAGAICDLTTSGYGASEWDKDCAPLRGSVTISAEVLEGPNGEPLIDFQPAMRFRPNKEVMLFMREPRNDGKKRPSIEYCNNDGACSDESLNDASLKPFRVGSTSILGRRVKHFSGYLVQFDEGCLGLSTPLGDGSFFCDEDGGRGGIGLGGLLGRRSGYMVASGEDIADLMKDAADDRGRDSHGRK